MESNDGRYGWAADDPRWNDALAGGRGRLEPSPPRFGAADPAPEDSAASLRPNDPPQWPPPPPTGAGDAPATPDAEPAPETRAALPTQRTGPERSGPDLLGPPLAIGAAPAPLPAPPTGKGFGPPPVPGPFVGAASVPSPVPTSVPLRVHNPPPAAAEVALRPGYGLGTGAAVPATGPAGRDLAPRPRTTRLERRVRIRSRWSTEDEFRRAARVELFSDDARYRVLLGLTAGWYAPAALVYLAWVLLVRGGADGSGVLVGLLWLAAAAVVSLAVAGLLRWASIGWRTLTLSVAAAIIGGGITTIAQTLTG